LPWSDIERRINELKSRKKIIDSYHAKMAAGDETYKVQGKNPETGENEVVTESLWIVAGQLYDEYKQMVSDLAEIIQMSVCPLISEFPFLSKSVLSGVIPFLSDGIQSGTHRNYKDDLEKKRKDAEENIEKYVRKVAGAT
jgi:hypothetical protein